MLNIIADGAIKAALERVITTIAPNLEGTVIHLELPPHRSDNAGLDEAIKLAPSGERIVMMSFQSKQMLAADIRWHIAMGYPNVSWCQLPEAVAGIIAGLSEPSKRIADPLAQQLANIPSLQTSKMGTIVHDMNHALNDGGDAAERFDPRWMPLAKELFGDLSRDELIKAVQATRKPGGLKGHFSGQSFSDQVCVDVEGTLLDSSGNLREDVLATVHELAETRPVTVWTSADISKIQPELLKLGIIYKVLSKELFAGAHVGIVIDDLPEAEFATTYNISYNEYRQV